VHCLFQLSARFDKLWFFGRGQGALQVAGIGKNGIQETSSLVNCLSFMAKLR
jgi:hypothetical protein